MKQQVGENVEISFEEGKIVITVPDAKAEGRPSSTGKSKVIATTKGYARFGNLGVSLNVIKT